MKTRMIAVVIAVGIVAALLGGSELKSSNTLQDAGSHVMYQKVSINKCRYLSFNNTDGFKKSKELLHVESCRNH